MKNFFANLAFISAAVLLASCNKEPNGPAPVDEHQFNCTIERVSFDGSARIPAWGDSDAIGVTTEADANVKCEIKDISAGTFHDAGVKGKAPYFAVYPYGEDRVLEDNLLTATVPIVQQLVAGRPVAPDAVVSFATSEDKNLSFCNCMALFKITIPRDDIKKVEIYTNSIEEKLAGQFTLDVSQTPFEPVLVEDKCDSVITLLPAGATFTPGSYYAAFLPGEYNGINVNFTNTLDETVTTSKTDVITVSVNEGCQLGNFFYYEISTAEELAQWARESAEKSTPWDVVTIMSNIDMTGVEYTEATNFSGVFNAQKSATQNYRISGLTKSLFDKFYGKCVGVDLESNIVYDGSWGLNYGCGMFSHYNYSGKRSDASVENVNTYGVIECNFPEGMDHQFNLGGISGATNGVPMKNCTNNAEIRFTKLVLSANYLTIGGIVGAAQSSALANLTDCKNYGSITIRNADAVGRTLAAGGLCGYVTQALTFTNLENHGTISMLPESKQVGNRVLGGIVAQSSVALTLVDCRNDAPITLTPGSDDTANSSVAAGILGYASGKGSDVIIDNCTNSENGTITVSGGSNYSCPGGIVGWSVSSMNIIGCTNNADITFYGTSASDLRMGGILGNCANDTKVTKSTIGSTSAGCYNTGKVTNAGGASKNAYIGGILGCSGSKQTDVINCHNTGDVINNTTAAMSSSLCMGGLAGYSGTAACTYEDCTSKSDIVKTDACSHKVVYAGTIHGNSNTTINAQHNGLGGSVLGVALTSDNFLSKYYGNKKTYNIDADSTKEKSYFIQ